MAGYIGTTPVPQATQHRESFTATGGQTSFATVGYTPQFIDVYLNGVKLAPADFTATNGSDVVLASGATASDILEIVAYTPFEVANQTFTGTTTAANLTVTGAFTSQGIDDNANATAITINSSENVGIGISSPSAKLEVKAADLGGTAGDSEESLRLTTLNANVDKLVFTNERLSTGTIWSSAAHRIQRVVDTTKMGYLQLGHVGSDLITFGEGTTERMRIDGDGNLLVGTTSTAISNEGAVIFSSGVMTITNDDGRPLRLNRKTSDGSILDFDKDGSTVGSIGVEGGNSLYIHSGDTGLRFSDSSDKILPVTTSGSARDNAITLGSSGARFVDLYLSGGVYLGGTGSDNFLNDYEHGFFTPTFGGLTTNPSGVTYDSTVGNEGYYVKVGRAVFVQINIRTDGISNVGAGGLVIQGLPFVAPSLSGQGGTGSLAVSQAKDFAGEVPDAAYVSEGLDYVTLFYRSTSDGNSAASQCSDLGTTTNDNLIRVGGTYYVTV